MQPNRWRIAETPVKNVSGVCWFNTPPVWIGLSNQILSTVGGYHELTQFDQNFPHTHYLEGCQQYIANGYNITRTPGNTQGAEMNLLHLINNDIRCT